MKTHFTQQTMSGHVIVSNTFMLFLVLITMVLFSSCKDETITIADTNSKALDREKLKFALHRNESLTLKERDTWYTISESVDLLNDGLNFLYCRPGEVMFNLNHALGIV